MLCSRNEYSTGREGTASPAMRGSLQREQYQRPSFRVSGM